MIRRLEMKKYLFVCWLCSAAFISPLLTVPARAAADEGRTTSEKADAQTASFDEIVVTGDKLVKPTRETGETVYTGEEVTRKGIEIKGSKAEASVFEAINILPGINVETPDPYSLSAEQKNVRIRGVKSALGAMTVEGIPNYGGNPMGPRDYLYDTENFQSIGVYKGAAPADLGTGVGARGGAVEIRPLWPRETFGVDLSQGFGMDNYIRTFFRVDSGALPCVDTRLSLSYSFTDADKWKGPGGLGPRNNLNFMIEQPVTARDSIQLWFNYNDLEQDFFRPLSFAEVEDLGANLKKDYNQTLTGVPAEDINFYRYNRGDFTNYDVFSVAPFTLSDVLRLSFKPYYSKEDSILFNGTVSQGGLVQQRTRDIERFGLISELNYDFSLARASLGYWVESMDMKIFTQNFAPGTLDFRGFGVFTENDSNALTQSPFLKLAGKAGNFDWQAGLKYFYYKDPAAKGFLSNPPNFDLVPAADLNRDEKEYDAFLPTAGLAYNFSETFQIHGSYGRNQIRPYAYLPLISLYNLNRAVFQNAGVTLNELFNGYDMEISDDFEVGATFRGEWFEIMPKAFYSLHDKLLTTVFDPRVNLSYYQNIGEATGYGFEMNANVFVNDNLTLFFNPTFIDLTYDEDLTFQGATLQTEGNQVIDTPQWLLKAGIIWKYKGFEVVPMLSYIGERFGDAEHTEKIDDSFLADLKISHTFKKIPQVRELKASLELYNLFDNEYVSVINAMDDNRAGAASYLVGAPFTALMKVSMSF
jgi:iron complex outermembrane receptor protein